MEKTQITTIDDLKSGFYGHVCHEGTFGGHDLYVAEIAHPWENETGWECGEWYLVRDNQAVHIAHCDGYDGIDWLVDDDDLLGLLGGDDDAVEDVKENVVPYNNTNALIAAAREETLEMENRKMKTLKKLKLKAVNKFHNRECLVLAKGDNRYYITRRQYKRYWSIVCGVSGCQCSTDLIDDAGNEYLAVSQNGLANPDIYEIVLNKHL